MSQYVKDDEKPTGWRVVSYANNNKQKDEGAPVTAEGMEEEGGDESGGEEEPDHAE